MLKISSLLVVVLVFVAIEVVVRIVFPARGLDKMMDLGPINLFTTEEIGGETWYQISNKNAYNNRKVRFKAKKDSNQLRIICLGGSASAGWPHPPDEIYSSYLEKTLQTAYPDKDIEIINCSAHGFASYRIRQVFETIIPLDPDGIIIWSGNNEFLEGRHYRTSAVKNALINFRNNVRSLQLLRELFVDHRYDDSPEVTETFWKKINQQALELRSNPEQLEKVKEHYRESLTAILEESREHNIAVMLMTVAVNLRDWKPNVSWLDLNPSDSLRWLTEFRKGKNEHLLSNHAAALNAFQSALKIAPSHAETMFWMARALESMGDTTSALDWYTRSKDFDYNPFRAISDFNAILRSLSDGYPGVTLLDMERLILPYARRGLPGFDMFLDYVHPTREGNLIIAHEAANHIIQSNFLPASPTTRAFSLPDIVRINGSDYRDEEDMFVQFTRFSLCCMMHQYNSALEFGKTILNGLPSEAIGNDTSGRIALLEDAVKVFQAYADLEQRAARHESTAEEEARMLNDIRAFYATHFPYRSL